MIRIRPHGARLTEKRRCQEMELQHDARQFRAITRVRGISNLDWARQVCLNSGLFAPSRLLLVGERLAGLEVCQKASK